MSEKLWQGRFSEKTDRIVEAFTSSIQIDRRLYTYDIQGSMAHCKMLAKVGIISKADARVLIQGLEKIRQEIAAGRFQFDDALEDIHMHIEARLGEIAGPVAEKLHTARSRNDQIALDVRMYLRHETSHIIEQLHGLLSLIVGVARKNLDVIMPGYTHLQRAQPVLLAHHLMAYYEMFSRDMLRLDNCLSRINVMPLGAAALAGTTYPIDRAYTATLLRFDTVAANSIDAVSDRDFIMEFLADASIAMVHFSRLSEELILWSSAEFDFVEFPDAFATGSSIMPQKKNPDVAELVRGKTGAVIGCLTALLTMMKSLPLAYNRDMQEDKKVLFDAVDTLAACIEVYSAMLPKLHFNQEKMQQAAAAGYLDATDMADYLVSRGMSFRQAHRLVGEAVSFAMSRKKELHALSLDELQAFSPLIRREIFSKLSIRQMVDRRECEGGTATGTVKNAIATAEKKLNHMKAHLPDFHFENNPEAMP